MPRRRPRDLQRAYSRRQFASKLRRLASAVERGRAFTIQVAGERILIPKAARFNIEHERTRDGTEELEFQLLWDRDAAV
jgi:amphi-Trp domain-containing protein